MSDPLVTFERITGDQYDAISGKEGGGMMGCVFKYQGQQMVARRSFDEQSGAVEWQYHRVHEVKRDGE